MKASNAASASFLVSAIQISTLGLRLLAFGQLVQDIGGLVHPTALAARPRPHLLDRLPEAEGAVGDRELGSHRKPPPFEIEEELFPRLRALAHAVDDADKFPFCLRAWRR